MTVPRYYHMCNRGIGRAVEIRTKDGRIHRGIIHRVDSRRVYLRGMPRRRQFGGFGYGYPGWGGWGFGWGFGWGVAFGAIAV